MALALLGLGALWTCRKEVPHERALELGGSGGEQVPRVQDAGRLGTNLAEIGYGYRNFPFVDLMKSADVFFSGTTEEWRDGRTLELRPDGFPARLEEGQIARTFLVGGDDPHFGGDVVVLHEGEGSIAYLGGVEHVERGDGRDVVTLRERDGLWIEIDETDPEDPLRNIRVLAPGGRCEADPMQACATEGASTCEGRCVPFEETYATEPFHPTFLAEHAPFDVLRFMNWMRTNRVRAGDDVRPFWPVREWSGYPEPGHAQWRPVPVDVMIDLANRLDAAPWLNVPHLASDAFVRRLAERVKERLEPELKVYVEYTNEAWNDLFEQSQAVNALGCRALAADPETECDHDDDGELCEYTEWNATQERCVAYGHRYFARRTAEIAAIFDDVFGGDERVVNVLATQVGSLADRGAAMLDEEVGGVPVHERVDVVAIAPYFGGGEPPATLEAVFARAPLDGRDEETYAVLLGEMPDGGPLHWIARDARALRETERWAHLPLIAYEGGQHFLAIGDEAKVAMLAEANRDPRMGALYDEYLARWAELTGGGLFVHYRSPSAWSEWGYWGSKEYQGQPLEEAPKHQALLRYLDRR